MHVRRLIIENPAWLAHLVDDLKIVVSRDDRAPHLVGLKYNQWESPMDNPIVRECRGMVVDIDRGHIVAHPYNKFFNLGEPGADEIDWATARALEKLDGTLISMYWTGREQDWAVATSGNPTAAGSYGDSDVTFRSAFWTTFESLGMQRPPRELRNLTWMLELCAPDNRIVVKYDAPRIVLHGGRDLDTGRELGHGELAFYASVLDWEVVRSFPIHSAEECLKAAAELDPIVTEGFVVVDAAFHRVKVKSPRYVELHQLKGEMSRRRAIDLWRTGEAPEVLAYFPELAPAITPVHDALDQLAAQAVASTLAARGESQDRKGFAAIVIGKPLAAVCFKLWADPDPTLDKARDIMRGQVVPALERMLDSGVVTIPAEAVTLCAPPIVQIQDSALVPEIVLEDTAVVPEIVRIDDATVSQGSPE